MSGLIFVNNQNESEDLAQIYNEKLEKEKLFPINFKGYLFTMVQIHAWNGKKRY